jgi:aspartyl protease family protein
MVALSLDHAEELGYDLSELEFTGTARTANGFVHYAPIVLEEVAVGDIVVRDVEAAVLEARTGRSLLGMSFLRKLAGFEITDDRLILRW